MFQENFNASRVSRGLIVGQTLGRKRGENAWVLHPDSTKRYAWDIITAVTTLFLAWRVPILVAFDEILDETPSMWRSLDVITDIVYIVDILINFR